MGAEQQVEEEDEAYIEEDGEGNPLNDDTADTAEDEDGDADTGPGWVELAVQQSHTSPHTQRSLSLVRQVSSGRVVGVQLCTWGKLSRYLTSRCQS